MKLEHSLALHESSHVTWLLLQHADAVVTVTCEEDSLITISSKPPGSFEELLCEMLAGAVGERVYAGEFAKVFASGGWQAVMATEAARLDLEQLSKFAGLTELSGALDSACQRVAAGLAGQIHPDLITRVAEISEPGMQASFRNKQRVTH